MLAYIMPVLMGGVIGCITNDLAIRMLFHPRKAIYIGSWRVPFTPGLIPAQKDRIARSIGKVVGGQLLSADAIRELALNDQTIAQMEEGVKNTLRRLAEEDENIRALLERSIAPEAIDTATDMLCEKGSKLLMDKLLAGQISRSIAGEVASLLQEKVKGTILAHMVDEKLLSALQEALAELIQRKLAERGPELARKEIGNAMEQLLDTPLNELTAPCHTRVDDVAALVTRAYRMVLCDHLERVLSAVDVSAIVEARVRSFSSAQLEALIFGMMNRELKAIVWLGGVLGALMGAVNLLL